MIAASHQPAPVEQVALHDIRTDGGTQARAALNDETVAEYAANIEANDAMPPVVVFYDGAAYWLADGFHRVAARAKVGRLTVKAEVRQGTRRDAVLYACGANATHGLRRTNADKRRAVETLLRDDEWRAMGVRWVADAARVSVGLAHKMHEEWATVHGEQSRKPDARTGRDGRTINTANIGKRPAKPAPRAEEPEADEPDAPPPPSAPSAPRVVAAPAPVAVEPPPVVVAPAPAPAAPVIAEPVRDARGVEVPARLLPAWHGFAEHARAIEAAAAPLRAAIDAMLADTAGYSAHAGKSVVRGSWHDLREFAGKPLDGLRHAARELAPRYLCADCGGNDLACRHCDGAGWTPAARVKALDDSARKTAEARVRAGVSA